MTRLEILSPALALKLVSASAAKQRAASLSASEFAIFHAKVEHPLVEKALEKVRTTGVLTTKEKTEMASLVEQLDAQYFALQEAAEEGRASTEDCMRAFGQARAVAALSCAGGEDTFESATEAIYEAAATTDDKEELITRILPLLD